MSSKAEAEKAAEEARKAAEAEAAAPVEEVVGRDIFLEGEDEGSGRNHLAGSI